MDILKEKLYVRAAMPGSLSVEIFRDSDSRDLDTDAVEHGLDLVRQHAIGLEIVRRSRLLRLSLDTDAPITINTFRWPRLSADVNIILTNRELVHDSEDADGRTLGYAAIGSGVAVVSQDIYPHAVTAHETGHLLGLKRHGRTFDHQSHCNDPGCLMYKSEGTIKDRERIKKRGLKGWMERRGYSVAEYQSVEKPRTESFCEECADQLGYNAFWLLQYKSGNTVPDDIAAIARRPV